MAHEFLSVYLSDHLAGAQAALEILALLRKTGDSEVWQGIELQIAEDRAELERLMSSTGSASSTLRRAAAWMSEKLAELKLRVDDPSGTGHLRRLELIEALAIGIDGKQALWRALQATAGSTASLRSLDYVRRRHAVRHRGVLHQCGPQSLPCRADTGLRHLHQQRLGDTCRDRRDHSFHPAVRGRSNCDVRDKFQRC